MIQMPIDYKDPVKYIEYTGKTVHGNTYAEPVDKLAKYVGGINTMVPQGNSFREEHRLLYFCNFKVKNTDKFVVDGDELFVKQCERVVDIFGNTEYWRVELK